MTQPIQSSLIIPTLNRPEDLRRCLNAITKLTKGFDEILIVEQGDLNETTKVVNEFKDLNIHVHFHPIASGAQARNVGIEQAQGNFVFFIDDDTTLDSSYVQVALDYFESHPNVMGLTGQLKLSSKNYKNNILARLFQCLFLLNGPGMKINRAGAPSNDWIRNKTQNAEWLFGGHMVYRHAVFTQGFRFNKHFIRRSDYEDAMFSYQVYKHYGKGSLVYLAQFLMLHFDSEEISMVQDSAFKMSRINHFIFWRKEVYNGSQLNLLCFIYNQFGVMLTALLHPQRGKANFKQLKLFAKTYGYILKNHRAIANEQIDYNAFIIDQ